MNRLLIFILAVMTIVASPASGDWDWDDHFDRADTPPDPVLDAFAVGVVLIMLASVAILLLGAPVLIVWGRRIRDTLWLAPSANLVCYLLSIRLRSYPGGFTARFRPPGLKYTLVEIAVLIVASLLLVIVLVVLQWLVRKMLRLRRLSVPEHEIAESG